MSKLKIEIFNPITPAQRLETCRNLFFESIDRRLENLEKAAEKYPPGYLNRSYIDGEIKGLKYARSCADTYFSPEMFDLIYK